MKSIERNKCKWYSVNRKTRIKYNELENLIMEVLNYDGSAR